MPILDIRLRYQTIEVGGLDVHLCTLRDKQQYDDPDGSAEAAGVSSASWPLFGVVWEGGRVLAEIVATRDVEGLRVLEVGCGIGLSSLVLSLRGADVTASDQHPQAEVFLQRNVELNRADPIPFVVGDWADLDSDLGRFDLIIGSDLLYEPDHVDLLAGFIDRHARDTSSVLLVDAGRGYVGRFSRALTAHGFTEDSSHRQAQADGLAEKSMRVLAYSR